MKINIAYPQNGSQKSWQFDDEKQWSRLIDRRLGQEVDGELLGPDFKGCVLRITGGSDKDGFAMKQGVMTKGKLKLFLRPGASGYFARREGTGKRKTVRGCVVGLDLAAINLVLVQKGEQEVAGLTDVTVPRRLGPKRANKIRKLFNLPKHSDNIGVKNPTKIKVDPTDVCRVVVRRTTKTVGDKTYYKAPKIQRLITAERVARKRVRRAAKFAKVKANQAQLQAFRQKEHDKHVATGANKPKAPANTTTTAPVSTGVDIKKTVAEARKITDTKKTVEVKKTGEVKKTADNKKAADTKKTDNKKPSNK